MKPNLLLTLIALSLAPLPASDSAIQAKVGQPLPQLAQILPGSTLPETKGKVVLVDFWASWCGPCKESFPTLNRLQEKYKDKGLVIIGIGVDETEAKHKAFAEKLKASFTLVHDGSHKAAAYFKPSTMPTSYLVDRKGVIRHIHAGFKVGKTEEEYVREIEALLAETL